MATQKRERAGIHAAKPEAGEGWGFVELEKAQSLRWAFLVDMMCIHGQLPSKKKGVTQKDSHFSP